MSDLCFKEQWIHSVQRAFSFACFFLCVAYMWDLCFKNKAYTLCKALVSSSDSCRIFASEWTNEMHFPFDNPVCRVETTCPLVRLDNLGAVPSRLMRCIFDSTTLYVESRQFVLSYKLWKVFLLSCHVDSIGHDWVSLSVCPTRTQSFIANEATELRSEAASAAEL